MSAISRYKSIQWYEPKRYLFKGWGVTLWKWSGISLPLTNLHFGGFRSIGYDIFHNGSGIVICFPKIIVIRICWIGKIHWSMKYGIFQLIFMNRHKFEF